MYRSLIIWLTWTTVAWADWPAIQGPHWNGRVEESVEDWPAEGPEVLWDVDLGQGYSSVVVVGDAVVTQTQSSLNQSIICLDAATGTTRWEYSCGFAYEAFGVYPGPRSTPCIVDGRVYYATPEGVVGCLDLKTGRSLWKQQLVEDLESQGVGFGYAASPLVINGLVILPCGGRGQSLVALDAKTGRRQWGAGDESASYCTVLPIEFSGETLLVGYLQNSMMIVDLQGNVLWNNRISVGYDEHSTIPVYTEPLLVFAAPFQAGATAYRLESFIETPEGRRLQVKEEWAQQKFSNDVNNCLATGGMLLGFDLRDPQSKAHRPSRGEFRALNATTGEILWSTKEIGQAGLILAGDQLLAFSDNGEIVLADVTDTECKIRCRAKVFHDEVCWTRPALSDGRLFLRGGQRLVCLKVGSLPDNSVPADSVKRVADLPQEVHHRWQWLINGEREHPLMPPLLSELLTWFITGLICLLVPLLPLMFLSLKDSAQSVRCFQRSLFAGVVLSIAATPLLNEWRPGLPGSVTFHFAWPTALFGSFQIVLLASFAAGQEPKSRSRYWLARALGVLWLLVSWGYFHVLKECSLPLQWVFLIGFLPAAPLCYWASYLIWKRTNFLSILTVILCAYAAFFWIPIAFSAR
ncbi:MAG: PQQ-binding-like beta-propeller repeat protein [Planctomycetaceae bacterium]